MPWPEEAIKDVLSGREQVLLTACWFPITFHGTHDISNLDFSIFRDIVTENITCLLDSILAPGMGIVVADNPREIECKKTSKGVWQCRVVFKFTVSEMHGAGEEPLGGGVAEAHFRVYPDATISYVATYIAMTREDVVSIAEHAKGWKARLK